MSDNLKRTLTPDESSLNDLFKELLDGVRDDIQEAQANVKRYDDAIESETGGKDLYGPLHNAALSIKGAARDRFLKFLNLYKDRVTKKEAKQMAEEMKGLASDTQGFDHTAINQALEEMRKKPKE